MRYAGEFAALGTAVCWAAGSNFFAAAGQRMGSVVLNRLRITVAVVLLGTALFVTRGSPWPVWATPSQVWLLALSGLVGFVFGDLYYFRALVILGPGRAALVTSMSPIFTLLIGWPVLGETPGPLVLLGMALTLGGITWVLLESERREHAHVEGSVTVGVVAGVLAAARAVGRLRALEAGDAHRSRPALGDRDPRGRGGRRHLGDGGVRSGTCAARSAPCATGGAAAFMVGGAFFGPFLGVTLSLTALKFIEAGVAAAITSVYPVLTLRSRRASTASASRCARWWARWWPPRAWSCCSCGRGRGRSACGRRAGVAILPSSTRPCGSRRTDDLIQEPLMSPPVYDWDAGEYLTSEEERMIDELEAMLRPPVLPMAPYPPKAITARQRRDHGRAPGLDGRGGHDAARSSSRSSWLDRDFYDIVVGAPLRRAARLEDATACATSTAWSASSTACWPAS